jgi:hypothetical protein
MSINLVEFWTNAQWALLATGTAILTLAVWLTGEAWIAVRRFRRHGALEPLEVSFRPAPGGHLPGTGPRR